MSDSTYYASGPMKIRHGAPTFQTDDRIYKLRKQRMAWDEIGKRVGLTPAQCKLRYARFKWMNPAGDK